MDDDCRDLANRLFAIATAMLEDAVELAAAGQSPRLTPSQLAKNGRCLEAIARDVTGVAEAATIIANLALARGRKYQKRRR